MIEVVLLCQLVVAGVFLVSAFSKLLDIAGTTEAVTALGVPHKHAPLIARVVPPTELGVALLLLVRPGTVVAAAAALLLLGLFTAVVAENLRRGRRPDCHCFGRIGSSDISGRTIVRNLLLMALAAAGLPAEGTSWAAYSAQQSAPAVAALVGAAAVGVSGLVLGDAAAGRRRAAAQQRGADQQLAFALRRRNSVRGAAPGFTLTSLTGASVSLTDLLDGRRPVLLAFLSPGCGPCRRLRPVVSRWAEVFSDRLRVVVIATGTATGNKASFGDSGLPVLLDDDRVVAAAYDVPRRPAAVLVGADGELLGPMASGDVGVRSLLGAFIAGVLQQERDEAPADTLNLTSTPGPRATVTTRPQDDATFVVTDEVTGASVALDQVAAIIWQCLDGRSPLHEIARDIAEGFHAPRAVVESDVLRLVRHLGGLGMLAGVAVDPDAAAATVAPDPVLV